jgi:hypothetical protein
MIAIYGNIYHQYTPNVSIYTIHGSYGVCCSRKSFSHRLTIEILSADCLGSIDTFGAQIQQQEVVVGAARHQVELASDWSDW